MALRFLPASSSPPSSGRATAAFIVRCEYQPIMGKHKQFTYKVKSFNFKGDLKAVPENRDMTVLGSNKDYICRRDLLLYGFWGPISFLFAAESGRALDTDKIFEEPEYGLQVDEINGYTFSYPLNVPKRQYKLKWIQSRKPERYSSAAPLSADARQRIVSERLDIKDNLVISVSIGPPNNRFLTSKDKNTWDAKDVAESVLSDKSTARVTTGERVTEKSVINVHSDKVDGEPYWYYEYIAQKSPTTSVQQSDVFRHSLAVTVEREGYLYSLNASALSPSWNTMEPLLRETISSFRLTPPTQNYVPPYKDPWRIW